MRNKSQSIYIACEAPGVESLQSGLMAFMAEKVGDQQKRETSFSEECVFQKLHGDYLTALVAYYKPWGFLLGFNLNGWIV